MDRKAWILEKDIERRRREKTRAEGGLELKFVSPGTRGVPDRIVLYPGGVILFREYKRPGQTLDPLQKYWKAKLERLGFKVEAVDEV